jgi:hypothetical protein
MKLQFYARLLKIAWLLHKMTSRFRYFVQMKWINEYGKGKSKAYMDVLREYVERG